LVTGFTVCAFEGSSVVVVVVGAVVGCGCGFAAGAFAVFNTSLNGRRTAGAGDPRGRGGGVGGTHRTWEIAFMPS
jgi:hypothetical protein